MKAKAPVVAKASLVSNPVWNVGYMDKGSMRYPARERWIKRGGVGKTSGSGLSGWKLRPSKVLARSLADRKHGKGKG